MGNVKTKRKVWTMPKWMEPYRDLFQNTAGNSIEDLMNYHDMNGFSNIIRSALIISVSSQVELLWRAGRKGLLVGVDPKTLI